MRKIAERSFESLIPECHKVCTLLTEGKGTMESMHLILPERI
jgi:hypothetical protein